MLQVNQPWVYDDEAKYETIKALKQTWLFIIQWGVWIKKNDQLKNEQY